MISILAMLPISPELNPRIADRARELITASSVRGTLSGAYKLDPFIYDQPVPKHTSDCRPWSRVARVRNEMLDSAPWASYTHLFWIDADVVEYEPELPLGLIKAVPDGIAAPMIYVEDMPGAFYDWAAFIYPGRSHVEPMNRWHIAGRNISRTPPYFPESVRQQQVILMDCVGTCYTASTEIFKTGVRFEDHPAFTDHFPICDKARSMNRAVAVCRDLSATHAHLPKWGHKWH